MTNQHAVNFDIAIIGMGVRDVTHMTIEAVDVLTQCRRGFSVSPDQSAVDVFREALSAHLRPGVSIPPLVSLSRAYRRDRLRYENYHEAGSIVLEAARTEVPVAYLTPGNPVTFDSVAQEILRGAREGGLRAVVVPGVSSIDTVLVDLQQELAPGIQIYEASWAVGMGVRPDTRLSCLLVQTSLFGTHYPVIGRQPLRNTLAALKTYLLQFYPTEHLVALVRSGSGKNDPPSVHPVSLGSLDEVPPDVQLGASMFIPPLEKPSLDEAFDTRMASTEILKELYRESPQSDG